MKFDKCLCSLAGLVLFAGNLPAQSQTPDSQQQPPAPAAPAAWSAGPIDFSGLVDGYYSLNFNHPASGTNNLRNFDVRANSFSLNMAKLVMEHSADPVGFRVDLAFGRSMELFHLTEPFQNGSGVMRNIMQAYVSFKPEKLGGFQFDFGKFVTSAGAELTETHLNWNYSRAFLYANGPYYHFGARMSKPFGRWTPGFQLVNGWNNVEDNNSGKTVGITNAFSGKRVSLYNNYYFGPEKTGTNAGYRHFVDTVLLLTPTDKAGFYVNYDYGVDKNEQKPHSHWNGIAFAGRYQVVQHWAFAARYEFYNDINGFITGTRQHLQEFTGTLEYKHPKGFLTRLEYRRDWSNQPYFDRGNENASAKSQDTLLLGFVVYFGPR